MPRHHGTRKRKRLIWNNHRRRRPAHQRRTRRIWQQPRENNHHCIPRSRQRLNMPDDVRIETPDNIRRKPIGEHNAWHDLFDRLTPKEVIRRLEKSTREQILSHNGPGSYAKRQRAWNKVFANKGAKTKEECIEIVVQDWKPPHISDYFSNDKWL